MIYETLSLSTSVASCIADYHVSVFLSTVRVLESRSSRFSLVVLFVRACCIGARVQRFVSDVQPGGHERIPGLREVGMEVSPQMEALSGRLEVTMSRGLLFRFGGAPLLSQRAEARS